MSLFAALLPKLVSGAVGILGASRARQQAMQDRQTKFSDLRKSAQAGGFNPLTALLATGGAGFGEGPTSGIQALATSNMFQDVIETAFDQQTDAGAVRRRQEDGQLAVKKAQLQSMGGDLNQPGARSGLGLNTRNGGHAQAGGEMTEVSRPQIAGSAGVLDPAQTAARRTRLGDFFPESQFWDVPLVADQQDYAPGTSVIDAGPLMQFNTTPNGEIVMSPRGEEIDEVALNMGRSQLPFVRAHPYQTAGIVAGGVAGLGVGTVFATRGAVGTANLIQSAPSRLGRLATALRAGPAITANVRQLSTGGGPALPHVPLNSLFLN